MVRVKLNKLGMSRVLPEDPYLKADKVYEAFELRDERCDDNYYKHYYLLNIGVGVYHAMPEDVEIIEDVINDNVNDNNSVVKSSQQKILLVEDGSVDIDSLEEWCNEQNIKLIVYRNGANKPEWLNL